MPLLIKTKLNPVPLKGLGLIADEFIIKNQVIYRDDVNFDRIITLKQIKKMPLILQEFILTNAAYSASRKEYYLCCDNARFWNHSENPNTRYLPDSGEVIALRDININEELTSDYREFCDYCKDGNFGFNICP